MGKRASTKIAITAYKEFVGQNLIDARKSLGWSQARFARELGVSGNQLNQWEKGLYYPNPWYIKRFCDNHSFTMDWFYRRIRAGVSAERADDLRQVMEEA